MNKTKVLVVLMMLVLVPALMFADARQNMDRLELGVSAGVGFYVGQKNPVAGSDLLRVQSYDAIGFGDRATLKWPGIETFGFSVGYRFDTRWSLVAKSYRQRVCFAEYQTIDNHDLRAVYYNAMWHVDVMAEYNLLNYGNIMMPKQKIYNVVPYVGFGLGVTMFNENATLRALNSVGETGSYHHSKMNTRFPAVGKKYETMGHNSKATAKNDVAVGMYVPVAFGVKWRLNDNVQLKGTFQYQLYLSGKNEGGLNSNLEGATRVDFYQTTNQNVMANLQSRPVFEGVDGMKKGTGLNHDCVFSISAIFNLGKWYEDRLITY